MDDDTYSLSDFLKKNTREYIFIWIFQQRNGAKYLVNGNNHFYISENG